MKVYIDELPKSCRDCPCMESDGYGYYTCLLYYKKHDMLLDCEDYKEDSRPNECLLQSLAEHDKQVKKEICDKIRENAISHNNLEVDMYYITPQQLYEIEKGENK